MDTPVVVIRDVTVVARGWLIVLTFLVGALFAGCGASDDQEVGEATPDATAAGVSTALGVSGLFTDPRARAADRVVSLDPPPASSAGAAPDGEVVVYDLDRGDSIPLGRGMLGLFNQVETLFAWVGRTGSGDPAELRVMDVWSRTVFNLGPAGALIRFENDQVVRIANWEGDGESVVDLATGARVAVEPATYSRTRDGYYLAEIPQPTGESEFTLWDGGTPLLRFEAARAIKASEETVVALVAADDGTGNIFLIDVAAREATFTGTAPTLGETTLVADDRYLVWASDRCLSGGLGADTPIWVYRREDGELLELGGTAVQPLSLSAGGALVGVSGGMDVLLDLESLDWDAVLPTTSGGTVWSAQAGFAATGPTIGSTGACRSTSFRHVVEATRQVMGRAGERQAEKADLGGELRTTIVRHGQGRIWDYGYGGRPANTNRS